MPADLTRVRNIFKNLETGDGNRFFTHVADDGDWIVQGTHSLAGHCHGDFLSHTFERLDKVLPRAAELYAALVPQVSGNGERSKPASEGRPFMMR